MGYRGKVEEQEEARLLRAENRTLKEIGEALGLTRERVRQIETEALHKLAAGLEGETVPATV